MFIYLLLEHLCDGVVLLPLRKVLFDKKSIFKHTQRDMQSLQFVYLAMPLGMGDPSSPTRGGNHRSYINSVESQPLDCQESPNRKLMLR